MEVLLDSCEYQSGVAIFAINHKDENSVSVIIPDTADTFCYLGLDDCYAIPIGEKVEVADDEGEVHEITRLT